MTIKHLDHLNLTVDSLADTIDWYERIFGFEIVERGVSRGIEYAIIRGGEALLCMYERPRLREPDAARGHHRISHFSFRITDVDAWLGVLEREQPEVHYGPIDYPHSTSWYVSDPTGYEIEVVAWDTDTISFPGQP